VELLIEHGADPLIKDKSGASPLDRALQYRQARTVAVFLDRGLQGGGQAENQLKDAVLRGQRDMVGILLDRGVDPNPGFLLHDAALKGFPEIVEMLIAHGAKVDAVNAEGATALHDAALAGTTSVIATLLDKGANINARDAETGATALHNAASWGRVDAVRILLKRGADASIANKSGASPLQSAIANQHEEIVAILKQGASRE
jgi:ankyrin repeat protein